MAFGRKKREYLDRTDHRLDLSLPGRNFFVSQEKQAQSQAARRIRLWMRVVLGAVCVGLAGVLAVLTVAYVVPWVRDELTVEDPSSAGEEAETASVEPALLYDDLGLPVLGDDLCLFTVSPFSPAPEDLSVTTRRVGDVRVEAHITDAVEALQAAANEAGFALTFTQGYTDYAAQQQRFEAVVQRLMDTQDLTTVMARDEAARTEPEPGESDFQTGLCLRLYGDPATFADSRTYTWLKANMGTYGFVFRYPAYKEEATGLTADWTVIRYVGRTHAQAMQQLSLCLEEYLDYLDSQ